ncbi:MAG: hypothetical protein JWQ49_5186 [Edaphobacter sp.]|nr:hypothetical protein [Edaphobacter sp.]
MHFGPSCWPPSTMKSGPETIANPLNLFFF